MQKELVRRRGIADLLEKPELLEKIEPNLELVKTLLTHRELLNPKTRVLARKVIEKVVEELRAGGYPADTPAAVVYRATWEDEQVLQGTLADIAAASRAARLTTQALILVGPAIDPALRRALAAGSRSHLYRPDHAHRFRKAAPAR
jgi:precorrin-4 methylase